MAHPDAKITLTVTAFNGLKDFSNTNRFCVIDDPVITDDAGGRVYTIAGDRRTLRVKNGKTDPAGPAKPIDLVFTILPAGDYLGAGVLIDGDGLNDNGTSGNNNFTLTRVDGNKILVKNAYKKGKAYFELFLGIQQVSTGRLGLIDPGVENSEEA